MGYIECSYIPHCVAMVCSIGEPKKFRLTASVYFRISGRLNELYDV